MRRPAPTPWIGAAPKSRLAAASTDRINRSRPALLGRFLAPALLLVALTACADSSAQSCVESGDIQLTDGERLDCDLFVLGGSLLVDEGSSVAGSVNVPMGSARIRGKVDGDVSVLRDLSIEGEIEGDASALAGNLEIDGDVSGAAFAGRDLAVTGSVSGDASAGNDARVEGRIGGDLDAGQDIQLGSTALVDGRLQNGGELREAQGAQHGGLALRSAGQDMLRRMGLALLMIASAGLFAALATAAAPRAVGRVREASGSWLPTTFLGLLAFLVLPFLALLVLPVLPYIVALTLGLVGAGERVGARLMGGRGRSAQSALGASLIAALGALALLPGTGGWPLVCGLALAALLAGSWSLGSSIVTLFGRRDWPLAPDEDPFGAGLLDEEPVPMPDSDLDGPFDGDASSPAQAGDAASGPSGDPGSEAAAPAPLAPNPLSNLPGITPIYAEVLREAGVDSIAALAELDVQRVKALIAAPGVKPADEGLIQSWLDAARGGLDADG